MANVKVMGLGIKIFWISFCGMAGLIVIIWYLTQNFMMDTFKTQQTRYVANLLERTEVHLNLFMKTLQGNLLALSRDERLQTASDDEAIKLMESYLMYWNQDLKNMYLIRPDLKVIGTSDYLWDIKGHRMAPDIYKAVVMSDQMYWSEPYVSDVSDHTVTAGVSIYDAAGKFYSVLAVDLDLQNILSSYGHWDFSQTDDLLIVSRDFRPISIYHPLVAYNAFDDEYRVKESLFVRLAEANRKEWNYRDAGGNGWFISRARNNNWGWQIMAVLPEKELYSSIGKIRFYTLLVGLIGVMLSLVISYYLSRYVSRPIYMLIRQMKRVSRGDFQTRITLPFRGEIGILVHNFNLMVQKIKGLMDELLQSETSKKQYELKVLQAQIQPHFLYNTLNSISYLVRRGETDDVDRMITSLVEMLHFHLDKIDEIVPIRQEAQGVEHYAYLLSMRYPGRFSLEVELDESVNAFTIPKLTLQPLVENAIFHGILAEDRCGTIVLTGRVENGAIVVLEVSDDGVGIPESKLGTLLRTGANESRKAYYHLGIRNIHERLQLHYGPEYGLHVQSIAGEGTTVTITLPAVPDANLPMGGDEHAASTAR
ncbi:sensor histidine kinase [Paenibacillus sanfengchensis]|uniref:sensor histidine kinase n=1 Tax=Paenibacillus sanfengchensis TaxID=3119819 RepID=UPI002FE0A2CE